VVELRKRSSQEAAPQRAISYQSDAQAACGRQVAVPFDVSGPKRIFTLQRRDRMDLRSPFESCGRGFGKAQVPHLACAHELGHCTDRFLDRRIGIDTVLIIQIDGVDAEALQTRVTSRADVFRAAIDANDRAILAYRA